MSDTKIKQGELEPKNKDAFINNEKVRYKELYLQLRDQNKNLTIENKVLKSLINGEEQKNLKLSPKEKQVLFNLFKNSKLGKSFYFQIILGIFIIVLSLGFHILYLSVTNCLFYNGGDSGCWIKNWLGIDIHASFFIDLILYLLIALQSLLIILIIRGKFHSIKSKMLE